MKDCVNTKVVSHQDSAVTADGTTINSFQPRLRNGKWQSGGSCFVSIRFYLSIQSKPHKLQSVAFYENLRWGSNLWLHSNCTFPFLFESEMCLL